MMTIALEMAFPDAAWALTGAFVSGLVVVAALVWSVRFGIRVRSREQSLSPASPRSPRPSSGPVMDSRERREPDEVPRAEHEGERLTPHELHAAGSKRGADQRRPRWNSGSGVSGAS
ncbi:DUF6479 family protein [Streptomyces sp. NPDC047022]|uniref:DUF6479 family protein n=1 Tax=Streptomyces sp. NPDC047022 TaxID=3155737 RepID=UPI003405063B